MGVFLLVAVVGIVVSHVTPLREHLTTDAMTETARKLGPWGPLVVIGIGVVMPLLFLPRWPLAMVCGMVYGVFAGTVLANVASSVGAWVQFVMARHLLAPAAERVRRRSFMSRFRISSDRVFAVLVLIRAFPLSNFVATNLLAGSLRVRHGTFLAGSFLGMIPSTLLYASWGKLLKKPSPGFYALAIGLVVVITAATFLFQRRVLRWLRGGTTSADEKGANEKLVASEEAGAG